MKAFIISVFCLFIFAQCSTSEPGAPEASAPAGKIVKLMVQQMAQVGIVVDTLQHRTIATDVNVSGKIEAPPQNYISISAPLGGFLKSTDLLPGMKVNKGQVLAVLEDQQYIQLQEQFLQTKSKLTQSEKEYQRQKALNADKSASDKMFEQATTDYENIKATYTALREKLLLAGIVPEKLDAQSISRQAPIYSPIDGYVAKINANVGKYLAPSDVLFELVNPDDIHLALTVFEKDIQKIEVGQKVEAFTNHSNKTYPCEVILLGRNLGADRSIDVHCHFINYDHTLLPGMFMNAKIETGAHRVQTLPTEAIVEFDGKSYVFISAGAGNYELTEITKGNAEGEYTEIVNSNKIANQKIVVKGAYSLLMQLKNSAEEE